MLHLTDKRVAMYTREQYLLVQVEYAKFPLAFVNVNAKLLIQFSNTCAMRVGTVLISVLRASETSTWSVFSHSSTPCAQIAT